MKLIELTCGECGKVFSKEKKEYDRWIRNGRSHFYCTLTCSITQENKRNPRKGDVKNFGGKLYPKKKNDLSPFRWFLCRATHRDKEGMNLSVEFLQELWIKQSNGICPFTGWQLTLPSTTSGWGNIRAPNRASLDRIDNSVGYKQGNVRYVSVMANYARNTFSDKEVIEFGKAISSFHKS